MLDAKIFKYDIGSDSFYTTRYRGYPGKRGETLFALTPMHLSVFTPLTSINLFGVVPPNVKNCYMEFTGEFLFNKQIYYAPSIKSKLLLEVDPRSMHAYSAIATQLSDFTRRLLDYLEGEVVLKDTTQQGAQELDTVATNMQTIIGNTQNQIADLEEENEQLAEEYEVPETTEERKAEIEQTIAQNNATIANLQATIATVGDQLVIVQSALAETLARLAKYPAEPKPLYPDALSPQAEEFILPCEIKWTSY